MKPFFKKQSLFAIVLIVILVILITIPILLYFYMSKTGDSLKDIINRIKEDDHYNDINVKGVGIYKASGKAINRAGSAPEQLSSAALPSYFIIDDRAKTVRLIRPTGSLDFPADGGYIFLELDVRGPLAKTRSIKLFGFIMFVVLLFLFIFIYKKNVDYRKKMASQEQLARLGEIARTLSHEIKNPLSAIRIQTGYLKRTLPKEHCKELKVIEEEVQRLALLTNRMGDFIRDRGGSPEIIELASFMNDMIKRFDWEIRFNNRTESGLYIQADLERLRSVIENLLKNAIESMEGGHAKNPVEIRLSSNKRKVELSILDRGCGIPSEGKKKVFDPFFTTKTKGSGIGLFVSRRFIEATGGSLSILSRKGGGTEARIVFKKGIKK